MHNQTKNSTAPVASVLAVEMYDEIANDVGAVMEAFATMSEEKTALRVQVLAAMLCAVNKDDEELADQLLRKVYLMKAMHHLYDQLRPKIDAAMDDFERLMKDKAWKPWEVDEDVQAIHAISAGIEKALGLKA